MSGNSYAPQAATEVGPCSESPTLKYGPLWSRTLLDSISRSRWGGQEGAAVGGEGGSAWPCPLQSHWRVCEAKEPISGSQAESIRTATRHLFLHIFRTSYTPTSYSSQDGTQNKLNLKLLVTFYFLSGHGEKGQNRVGWHWIGWEATGHCLEKTHQANPMKIVAMWLLSIWSPFIYFKYRVKTIIHRPISTDGLFSMTSKHKTFNASIS